MLENEIHCDLMSFACIYENSTYVMAFGIVNLLKGITELKER